MIKKEEIDLMSLVVSYEGKIPDKYRNGLTKREYGYLDKWSNKGFWEYGVTARSGWATAKGLEHFKQHSLIRNVK